MRIKQLSSVPVLLVLVIGLWSCSSSDPTPTPSISGFTPTSGPELSEVVITGTNFSSDKANNIVRFNGLAAEVTASASGSLTVKVPTGATSGVITVTVNGETGISEAPYTINPLIGAWRLTSSAATNCSDPAYDGAATCTLDCPTLTFTETEAVFEINGNTFKFIYTLTATTLTITGPTFSFSPTYVYAGGQLTLVYPPGDCSFTETYVKL